MVPNSRIIGNRNPDNNIELPCIPENVMFELGGVHVARRNDGDNDDNST